MYVFVQVINIPCAYGTKEQLQNLLSNVGRVNHASFHKGVDSFHYDSVIHLEIGEGEFEQFTLSPYNGEKITLIPIPEKVIKTLIGEDYHSHLNTPCMSEIGVHIWNR